MKKVKKGFTLAEVLLCIAIIGVVSAMGITIGKHGMDRAYNLYYYTGYSTLYNALADAKAQGLLVDGAIVEHVESLLKPKDETASLNTGSFLTVNAPAAIPFISSKAVYLQVMPEWDGEIEPFLPWEPTNNKWSSSISNLIESNDNFKEFFPLVGDDSSDDPTGDDTTDDNPTGDDTNGDDESDGFGMIYPDGIPLTILTSGAIKYIAIIKNQESQPHRNADGSVVPSYIEFVMSVPQRKTRANEGYALAHFVYINDNTQGLLVPLPPVTDDSGPNLAERRDLIAAFIDDGAVGRTIKNGASYEYKAPAYYTYQQAYCRLNSNTSLVMQTDPGLTLLSCNGVNAGSADTGVIRVANPQKAK